MTTIADKSVLVTGGNRGIGRALVVEALRRGATRVYVGTRKPVADSDARITPVPLDVTNAAQIQQAVVDVGTLDGPGQQRRHSALRRLERPGRTRTTPCRES